MEWWGWLAWAIAIAGGIAGTWLGIRAERRATHYEPLWVFDGKSGAIQAISRTGEDAIHVKVELVGAQLQGSDTFQLVRNNEQVEVYAKDLPQRVGVYNTYAYVQWTRPKTGKNYSYLKQKPVVPE